MPLRFFQTRCVDAFTHVSSPHHAGSLSLSQTHTHTTTTPHRSGYDTVYKGKFHLVKPGAPSGDWTQQDLANYGYARWNPPDAGADQSLPEGGGNPLGGGNNDLRCVRAGTESGDGTMLVPPVPPRPSPTLHRPPLPFPLPPPPLSPKVPLKLT